MRDFYNPHAHRAARKEHQCTYCGEPINKGDTYTHQTGVYDGHWYTSKMHPECFDDLCASGDGEYTPYSNERPPSAATVEFESWDCTLLIQRRLTP